MLTVPIRPTTVPIRLVQKLQWLISEEHVPIRLRVYRYPMHQNNIYEGKKCPNCSKTSQRSPTARRSFGTIKDTSKHP
ncbi:hypothetical protein GQ457_05G024160 [Hibiscus cannabinus]